MIYNAPEVKVLAMLANVASTSTTSTEEEEPAIIDAANYCL